MFSDGKKFKEKSRPDRSFRSDCRNRSFKNVTKFLIDAVTHDCVLDLSYLKSFYAIPPELIMQNETPNLKQWIEVLGGVEAYLKKTNQAPWSGV